MKISENVKPMCSKGKIVNAFGMYKKSHLSQGIKKECIRNERCPRLGDDFI